MRSAVKLISKYYLVLGAILVLFSWIVERHLYDKWDSRISIVEQSLLHARYLKLECEIVSARGSIEATLSVLRDNLQNGWENGDTTFRDKDTQYEYVYTIPDVGYNVRRYNEFIYDSMAKALRQLVACLPKDQNRDIYIEFDTVKSVINGFLSSAEIYDIDKSKTIDERANKLLRKTVQRLNDWLRATSETKQRWRKVFSVLYILGTVIIVFGNFMKQALSQDKMEREKG